MYGWNLELRNIYSTPASSGKGALALAYGEQAYYAQNITGQLQPVPAVPADEAT